VSGSAAEASGRCGCGEGTYYGISGNAEVPPISAIPAITRNAEVRPLREHSVQRISVFNRALLKIDIELDRLVE
jgi:uncharacterized circularly permuted ATP-grasp superfamily protein